MECAALAFGIVSDAIDLHLGFGWLRESMDHLTRALTAKQVGVIVHGEGIDVDAFEFDAEIDGLRCLRRDAYTELYRVAA